MEKYFQIAKNTWDESLAYRTSFILYRTRGFLQLLITYFVWQYVTTQQGYFFGYTQSTMLTYILIGSFVSNIIFATRTTSIASEINEGILTNFLIRPFSYQLYHFSRDFGDKAMNLVFTIGELLLFFLILHPPFIFQTSLITLFFFIISVFLGLILHFFISVLIGFLGFWSNEVWGPRFIFYQAIGLFSGGLFPLDVLPREVFSFLSFLPFSYLTYFPAKIYLGQVSGSELLQGILVLVVWIVVLYKIVQMVWMRGLKVYTAQGR